MSNKFMQHEDDNPKALSWLEGASVFEKETGEDWVKALRDTAKETFLTTGLPDSSWEDWKYTKLRKLENIKFKYSIDDIKFDAKKIPENILEDSYKIVIVNGQYKKNLTTLPLPKGVEVSSLMEASKNDSNYMREHLSTLGDLQDNPFKALNLAYMRDGFILKIEKDIEIEKPIEIIFYNIGSKETPPAIYPRMLYWIGENSNVTLFERHLGEGVYFTNSYSCVVQEKFSNLKLYKLEEETLESFHFSNIFIQQQEGSQLESFCGAFGGLISREEYKNQLIDNTTYGSIGGVYLLRKNQSHDFKILTEHFEPNGRSVQNFKGVVADEANAVFQGKIHVYRDAQKTDGSQINSTLLLSENAQASFKPELEIYADDVKCSHGATSGKIDEEALFYMRSRGIPEVEARALLVQSFLTESLEQISFEPIKEIYITKIEEWLKKV